MIGLDKAIAPIIGSTPFAAFLKNSPRVWSSSRFLLLSFMENTILMNGRIHLYKNESKSHYMCIGNFLYMTHCMYIYM